MFLLRRGRSSETLTVRRLRARIPEAVALMRIREWLHTCMDGMQMDRQLASRILGGACEQRWIRSRIKLRTTACFEHAAHVTVTAPSPSSYPATVKIRSADLLLFTRGPDLQVSAAPRGWPSPSIWRRGERGVYRGAASASSDPSPAFAWAVRKILPGDGWKMTWWRQASMFQASCQPVDHDPPFATCR